MKSMSFWFVIVKVTIFFFYIIYEKVIVGFILLPVSPIFFRFFTEKFLISL